MIDGGRLIERNDLRKVANRKKGVKEEKVRRKEKQGVKVFHGLRATSGYVRGPLRLYGAGISHTKCGH